MRAGPGRILGLEHIGIVVNRLDDAVKTFEALGLKCSSLEEVEDEKARIAIFPIGGSKIELLQSTSDEGVIARFIRKGGEGIHHIAFLVEGIEGIAGELSKKGFKIVDERPRVGQGGYKVVFVHPKSAHGVLIELREKPSS